MSKTRFQTGPLGSTIAKLVVVGLLAVTILYTIYEWAGLGEIGTYPILSNMTESIGNLLFTQWGVVVMVLALILFSAMMGGVFIAQEEDE
ncbi:MAG: NADH-quinone oxidoreductase subunit J [Methanomassiliicoccales archaeon]|nr:MAG: NADH-quinone oxidoreductase subunit J [Methanomassiliicoccales archaeon]